MKPKRKSLIDFTQLGFFFFCTQSRDRTGMEMNPLVFETSASTNSAIWANIFKGVTKVDNIFNAANTQ